MASKKLLFLFIKSNTSAYLQIGYILEVDLDYPDVIHDGQKDLPLAPTKEHIPGSFLADFQTNLLEIMSTKKVTAPKLLQTMKKRIYTVHFLNLLLYVELRMIA